MTQWLYPNWREQVVYGTPGPRPTTLFETDKFRAIVVGLEPGQKIPLHPEEAAAVFHFVEGTGWMQVGDERFQVQPGATVICPANAARGMEAETRLAFVATRIA